MLNEPRFPSPWLPLPVLPLLFSFRFFPRVFFISSRLTSNTRGRRGQEESRGATLSCPLFCLLSPAFPPPLPLPHPLPKNSPSVVVPLVAAPDVVRPLVGRALLLPGLGPRRGRGAGRALLGGERERKGPGPELPVGLAAGRGRVDAVEAQRTGGGRRRSGGIVRGSRCLKEERRRRGRAEVDARPQVRGRARGETGGYAGVDRRGCIQAQGLVIRGEELLGGSGGGGGRGGRGGGSGRGFRRRRRRARERGKGLCERVFRCCDRSCCCCCCCCRGTSLN